MRVRELIAKLQTFDQDKLVVLSADAEGNSYDTLHSVDDNYMFYQGEIGIQTLTSELIMLGFTEEDIIDGRPCIVLSP
jgi:hypothetical protein